MTTVATAARPRIIITTDLEVDDMNSLIHLALYLNLVDVEAFVTTASQYHFLGDGTHALGEVNPHWRTKGRRAYEWDVVPPEPDPEAGALTAYRPFPRTWIQDLWTHEYADAWPNLCANAAAAGEPAFPAPDELVARTYEGNVAFEGDVRTDTPGSDVIKRAIMDDDPRPLWLLSWGGMNTIVRALISIAEDWQTSARWDEVRQHVYQKVRVMGVSGGIGQDNSWLDHGKACFPELTLLRAPFVYGGYVDAVHAQEDAIGLFRAPWPEANLVRGNGPLMARYMLYGDGKVYPGEPARFQFGQTATLDWGWPGMEPIRFTPGDFMGEGDSMTYIPLLPLGLRGAADRRFNTVLGPLYADGAEPPAVAERLTSSYAAAALGEPVPGNPNPFLRAYQEDFAVRAAWCAHEPEACNHPPRIAQVTPDTVVRPGETVALHAATQDPDGGELCVRWTADPLVSTYAGVDALASWHLDAFDGSFTVPAGAHPGDRIVVTLTVRDTAAIPATRYAEVALTVR